jgi:hypothetical protein
LDVIYETLPEFVEIYRVYGEHIVNTVIEGRLLPAMKANESRNPTIRNRMSLAQLISRKIIEQKNTRSRTREKKIVNRAGVRRRKMGRRRTIT